MSYIGDEGFEMHIRTSGNFEKIKILLEKYIEK